MTLGIASALEVSDNAAGMLMVHIIREMRIIVKRLGGNPEVVLSLAGLGDMVLTGFSKHSRNRSSGKELLEKGEPSKKSEGFIAFPSLIELLENDLEKPRVPEYVGECILLIARRLSMKSQFINYPYKEDMISDGVENCLIYLDNWDPSKSQYPFAYFTQIIYYAFLRRIQGEKKHLYIQYKLQEENGFEGMNYVPGQDAIDIKRNNMDLERINNFITDYEEYKNVK